MAGRIIQLSPARRILEPPFIDTSIRADLADYGPPGWHLHGPLALGIKRRPGADDIDGGRPQGGLEGLVGAIDLCNPIQSYVLDNDINLDPATTTIQSSALFNWPFVLTWMIFSSNALSVDNPAMQVKISDNTLITQAAFDLDERILAIESFGPNLQAPSEAGAIQIYPGYVVRAFPRAIKHRFTHSNAAARQFKVLTGISRLQ